MSEIVKSADSEIVIQWATKDDIALILKFIKKLAVYEKLSHEVIATEKKLAKSLFGDRRVAEVFIAYVHDKPVGFCLFFHNFSTFLGVPGIYIEDLYVDPESRGKGIGREMLKFVAKLAVERGCGRVEWSVLDWNEPAISFYKNLGAIPMDGWTTFRLSGESLLDVAEYLKTTEIREKNI
jgi:GNAT superfamily N-acetyltransferase